MKTYHLSCSGQNVVIIGGEADSGYGALTLRWLLVIHMLNIDANT